MKICFIVPLVANTIITLELMLGSQPSLEPDGNVKNANGVKFAVKPIKMIVTFCAMCATELFTLIVCGLKWPQFRKMDGNAR